MSRTAVVLSLVVALGFAGAAFFLLRDDSRATPALGPLLAFDPATVRDFTVQRPGGRVDRIQQDPADPGEWVLRIGGGGPGAGRDWPVMAPQVRAMLRILSDLPANHPAPNAEPAGDAITLLIGLPEHKALTLRLGTTPLSGRVLARRPGDDGSFWVRADTAEALAQRGIMAWRDPVLFRGLGPGVSRVELRGPSGALVLSRGGGRWGLLEPIRAPADEDAVSRLVNALASVRASDFLDNGVPPETALETPSSVARITSTTRDASGAAVERTQELRVGRAADIAGTKVYVSISEDGAAPLAVAAAAEPLAALSTDPVAFIQRRAAAFPASDVGSLSATLPDQQPMVVSRSLSGWSRPDAQGQQVPLPPPDAAAFDALATLLTETPADQISLAAPEALVPALTADLRTLAGAPLHSMRVLVTTARDAPAVVIRTGEVWRIYLAPGALEAVRAAVGALAR